MAVAEICRGWPEHRALRRGIRTQPSDAIDDTPLFRRTR